MNPSAVIPSVSNAFSGQARRPAATEVSTYSLMSERCRGPAPRMNRPESCEWRAKRSHLKGHDKCLLLQHKRKAEDARISTTRTMDRGSVREEPGKRGKPPRPQSAEGSYSNNRSIRKMVSELERLSETDVQGGADGVAGRTRFRLWWPGIRRSRSQGRVRCPRP